MAIWQTHLPTIIVDKYYNQYLKTSIFESMVLSSLHTTTKQAYFTFESIKLSRSIKIAQFNSKGYL